MRFARSVGSFVDIEDDTPSARWLNMLLRDASIPAHTYKSEGSEAERA
jgi:hypothetical protein